MEKLLSYKEKTKTPSATASAPTARRRVSFADQSSHSNSDPPMAEFDAFHHREMQKLGILPPSSGSQTSVSSVDDPLQPNSEAETPETLQATPVQLNATHSSQTRPDTRQSSQ